MGGGKRPGVPESILRTTLRFIGMCLGIATVALGLIFGLGYLAGIRDPKDFSDILSGVSLALFLAGALSLFGGTKWRAYMTTSYGSSVEETPAFGRFRRATRDLWGSIRFGLGAFLIGAIFVGIAVFLYFHV
ncbi:hypothetical protein J7L84_00455 [Candidatus Bipolaricaulota bacterium]|nr:hypothetical protein [Candidatus Bipolaricaulota bacterium]